jgi:uncharacterized membrane protein
MHSDQLTYRNPLYWFVFLIAGSAVLIAIGPGLFGITTFYEWFTSWQKQVFDLLCHQNPERSIHLNETPMAVCSRCFGIYSSFFLTIVVIPLLKQSTWRNNWAIAIVIGAITLNVVDSVAYSFQIWENSITSRFWLGSLIGFGAAFVLGTERPETLKNIVNYGTK